MKDTTQETFFQEWIDFLDNRFYAGQVPSPENNLDKYGSIRVLARDYRESGEIVEEFNFENVFPLSVSDLEYSAADKDTIMEFTVTFAYYRMVNNPWMQGMLNEFDNHLDNFGLNHSGEQTILSEGDYEHTKSNVTYKKENNGTK